MNLSSLISTPVQFVLTVLRLVVGVATAGAQLGKDLSLGTGSHVATSTGNALNNLNTAGTQFIDDLSALLSSIVK